MCVCCFCKINLGPKAVDEFIVSHKSRFTFKVFHSSKVQVQVLKWKMSTLDSISTQIAESWKYKWQWCKAYVHLYLEYMAVPLARASKSISATGSLLDLGSGFRKTLEPATHPKPTKKPFLAGGWFVDKNFLRLGEVRWHTGVVGRRRRWRWGCRSRSAGTPS